MLPRNLRRAPNHVSSSVRGSPRLAELAEAEPVVVLERLGSSYDGVSEEEAARRLARYGPNVVASDRRTSHASPSVAAGVPEPPRPAAGRPHHRLPRDG